MFPGFRRFDINCGEAVIHGVTGGSGPPLLLLHGYPQTHAMWHKVAPELARRYTLVIADLRGYGASSKPASTADHRNYSKRAMAADMAKLMTALGHDKFLVAGHDRGGRVAHRMALDYADRIQKLAVLDIAPTREMYANTTEKFARAYWHWFFLIQQAPLPEQMISGNADDFWRQKCGAGSAGLAPFTADALNHYLAAFRNPETIRATCEDYRAAGGIDIRHDNEDGGKRVSCPLLALWGVEGVIESCFDCLALWRLRADNVQGEALPGGHYLAEELPELVSERLTAFFG